MKKIDLKCPHCGANMDISNDKSEVTCPYCQYKFLLEKMPNIDELSKREEMLSYARETGERRAIEDSNKRQKKKKTKAIIITILVVIMCAIITTIINYYSLEYMKDPFECVSIKFNGIDGSGEASVDNNETCSNFSDIEFVFSKEKELIEGEKITITAISNKYRFGTKSKEYIVSGLSKYLESLDNLSEDMLVKLYEFSYNYLKNNSFGITFSGEIESLVPYKLYLYTNNKDKNILYDVYKTYIKTKSGNSYEKLVVAYYEDFVLLDNKELFSYSKLSYCGNTIKAGDPNEYSAIKPDYAGNLTGFYTIEDFKSYLNKNNDGTFEIKEK